MEYQIFLVVVAIIGAIIVQVLKSERRSRLLNPPRRIGSVPGGYVPQPPGPGWAQAGPGYQPPPMTPGHAYHPQPSHQPPPHNLPTPQIDLDDQVRALMAEGNEVAAIRLLCDEAEMGIIEAQEYARALARGQAPESEAEKAAEPEQVVAPPVAGPGRDDEWTFFGSAALGGSPADFDERDEWASGWQDKPDSNDQQQFIEELLQSIREGSDPAAAARAAEIIREPGTGRDERTPPGWR